MPSQPPKQETLAGSHKWYLIDASGHVLGRLATRVATLLTGRRKVSYVPFLLSGDHVIIINAEKIRLTGQKMDRKLYRWHTGYPGGLREVTARKMFERKPDRMIRSAVSGMLPKNKLRKRMLKHLRVYVGGQHPHVAQTPELLSLD